MSYTSTMNILSIQLSGSWNEFSGIPITIPGLKEKFPSCGGFPIWIGHDCFPCMINVSIIDFESNPKPVAERLSEIWLNNDQIIYPLQ